MQNILASSTQFASNRWLVNLIAVLLSLAIVAGLVTVTSGIAQASLISRMTRGEKIGLAEAQTSDSLERTISTIQTGLYISTGLVFCFWIYRAYKNLRGFGIRDLTFSPGWAAVGFFIPVFNFYFSILIVNELWKASDPQIPPGATWQKAPGSPWITLWWLAFVLAMLVNAVSGFFSLQLNPLEPITLEPVLRMVQAHIANDVLYIVAAVLTLFIVQGINQRQRVKAAALQVAISVAAS